MNTKSLISVTENNHVKGNKNGIIEILEFVDFQCPYCMNASYIVNHLLDYFDGKIKFGIKHFPQTEFYEKTFIASSAAEAAANQNKFWEMHDQLFHYQKGIDVYKIYHIAEELMLDPDLFHEDFNHQKTKDTILQDFELGKSIGVTGTPTFFINGEKHIGDWTYKSLHEDIRNKLKA